MPEREFAVGDRVRFARDFLLRCQADDAETVNLQGTVTEVFPTEWEHGRLRIQWDDSEGNPELACLKYIEHAPPPLDKEAETKEAIERLLAWS